MFYSILFGFTDDELSVFETFENMNFNIMALLFLLKLNKLPSHLF